MSHEHHQQHHHHNELGYENTESYAAATDVVYAAGDSSYDNVPVAVETTEVVTTTAELDDGSSIAETHKRTHKREEVVGGLGALAAGAFAMYEGHEAKVDPEHARRHQLEEEIAGGLGVGSAGLGIYGHHEKEADEKIIKEENPEKKHGWF